MPLDKTIIAISPEAIIGLDSAYCICLFNPAAERLLGYRAAELIGQSIEQLVPERFKEHVRTVLNSQAIAETTTQLGSSYHEWPARHQAGHELTLEVAVVSIADNAAAHTGPCRVLAFAHNVTARTQVEHQLRQLWRAIEQSPNTIVITDPDGVIEYANPKFTATTGYTLIEALGQNPRILKSGDMPPQEYQRLWATITAGGEWRGEFHNKKKSGELYWEWASISPILDAEGNIINYLAVKEDITARKAAEEALRQSSASNRALLNAIPDLMFRVSRDGIYLDYKASDDVELYLPPSEFLGKRLTDFMPGDFSRQAMRCIESALGAERGRSQSFEYQLPIGGQLKHYEARVTASGPDEVLMLIREITERKRAAEAEREQRVLAEALRDTAAALNSSLNLDEVLDRILDNVGQVVPHDAANIMLTDGVYAKVARAHGYDRLGLHDWIMALSLPIADLLSLDRLSKSDSIVLASDTRGEPGWFELPQTHWVRSYVGVPIRTQDQLVGVLNLDSATPGFFTPAHGERLKAFANQAALAIENAQLISDTRRQADRERLINQITNRIHSSMNIDEIIKATVQELGRIIGASRCLIRLGADANYMPVAFEFDQPGIAPLSGQEAGLPIDLRARVLARQTLAMEETFRVAGSLYQAGIRAILATPITVRNVLSGALIFHECQRPRHWLPEQIELVETIAAQVGVAVENARLYHETRRQLGELAILHAAAIATANSTTLDEALHKVAQAVFDALSDVSVAVMLLEPGTDDLNIRSGLGYVPGDLQRIHVKVGQGVTGWVAQTGQPAMIPNVATDPRYANFDAEVRSELCVPLRSGSRVMGVLNIESHQLDAFTERDLQLLTTLSHNLTIIIENIRLLEEVQAANERLKELDRLKSQFLANMSHELRTPLNAIIGFSELISDGLAGPVTPEQTEYLHNINTSGRHLLALINDILDLSKIQAGRMTLDRQPVAVTGLVAETQVIIAPLATGKQQHLTIDLPPDLPPIEVDPLRIKQVLINLLGNACKFTPVGGQIALRVSRIDADLMLFSVSDTGRGIPPGAQTAIFEEFRQVSDAADREEGTGLGLAIAQRLIELHGGKIWVESLGQPGQGSTFYFTLPVQADQSDISHADRPAPLNALIIEDDRDFNDLLTLHVRQAGYLTIQCYTGEDARAALQIQPPDLITLDMQLPDISGWTLLQEIQNDPRLHRAGVLVISGQELAQVAATPGRVEYLAKPILKQKLNRGHQSLKGSPARSATAHPAGRRRSHAAGAVGGYSAIARL